MSEDLIKRLKIEARKIKALAELNGQEMIHSHALEQLSNKLGYKDWNTLRATAVKTPVRVQNALMILSAADSKAVQFESGHLEQEKRLAGGDRRTSLDSEADFRSIGLLKAEGK